MNIIAKAVNIIEEANSLVVLTGAGASTESGIPDFRTPKYQSSCKEKYDYPVETILSHTFFLEHTEMFYDYYFNNLIYPEAKPNDCHVSLAEMEKLCSIRCVITQNIDGLHQAAGSSNVIELHGTTKRYICMVCNKYFALEEIIPAEQTVPLCKLCGGLIKPDVVLYEEPLNEKDLTRAVMMSRLADVFLVIGTSLMVYPAAGLLNYYRGDKLIIINKSPTSFDTEANLVIRESAGEVMKKIVTGLKLNY